MMIQTRNVAWSSFEMLESTIEPSSLVQVSDIDTTGGTVDVVADDLMGDPVVASDGVHALASHPPADNLDLLLRGELVGSVIGVPVTG
jgi:hypothetical protein